MPLLIKNIQSFETYDFIDSSDPCNEIYYTKAKEEMHQALYLTGTSPRNDMQCNIFFTAKSSQRLQATIHGCMKEITGGDTSRLK